MQGHGIVERIVELAVHAEAHARHLLVDLDVNVRRPLAHGLLQEVADQLDDRGLI